MVECRENRPSLHLGERRPDRHAQAFALDGGTRESAQIELDLVVCHDEGPMYGVPELAHIAGPLVRADRDERGPRELLFGARLEIELLKKMLGQELGVALAL